MSARGAGAAVRAAKTPRASSPPSSETVTPRLISAAMSVSKTLYLCYFGLREPLVQTQVLPYLRQLAAGGIGVTLLTFEPEPPGAWDAAERERWEKSLAADGVRWLWLKYHKSPSVPATLYDIAAGARLAARLVRSEGIEVLHARAHVPMAMALLARRLAPCRTVFDIRGLMAEEYADAGVWREGSLPYRMVKRLERAGIERSDQIVVLTRRMRDWLVEQRLAPAGKIEVIPCCVDFARYEARGAAENDGGGGERDGDAERFEVVYAGSVTGLYLLEEMGRFFAAIKEREPRAFMRVLTKSPAGAASAVLKRVGLSGEDFRVGPAQASEVPALLRRARLGVSFRKATFSQIAASPTKVPEYLAAGLPVVSNAGIGDTDELIEREGVGVVVRELSAESYAAAAERALELARAPGIARRCEEVARAHFDLARVGGSRYREVYRRLGGPGGADAQSAGAHG